MSLITLEKAPPATAPTIPNLTASPSPCAHVTVSETTPKRRRTVNTTSAKPDQPTPHTRAFLNAPRKRLNVLWTDIDFLLANRALRLQLFSRRPLQAFRSRASVKLLYERHARFIGEKRLLTLQQFLGA